MVLSLKVLQLPLAELTDFLEDQIRGNPVVEVTHPVSTSPPRSSERDGDDEATAYDIPDRTADSLYSDLQAQIAWLTDDPYQKAMAEYLVGNLEPDGYLRVSLHELAKNSFWNEQELFQALRLVQQCEPPGVGARSVKECLSLQAVRAYGPHHLLNRLIVEHWSLLHNPSPARIARALNISESQAKELLNQLKTLSIKPFIPFESDEVLFVYPDVTAWRDDQGIVRLELNRENYPSLHFVPEYLKMKKTLHDHEVQGFLANAIRQARWLEQALRQRIKTLLAVISYMVQEQKAYCFDKKPLAPLSVKQVAHNTGLHESTVRRAIAQKMLQCPRGIIPVSRLLCESVSLSSRTSVDMIKSYIAAMIASEDADNPLSDADICQRLAQQGIPMARRTVAKYRSQLGYLTSVQRRYRITRDNAKRNKE